jgi:hypothetical protein
VVVVVPEVRVVVAVVHWVAEVTVGSGGAVVVGLLRGGGGVLVDGLGLVAVVVCVVVRVRGVVDVVLAVVEVVVGAAAAVADDGEGVSVW